MNDKGRVTEPGTVVFQRRLPGPIERAWRYLTEERHLADWMGPGSIEPHEQGRVDFGDGHIRGVVTEWAPPSRLAFTWNVFFEGDDVSRYPETVVTFDLETHGDEVLLTLTHAPINEDFEKQTMMGWHSLLDLLAACLRGEAPESRETVFERNRIRYGVKEIKQ